MSTVLKVHFNPGASDFPVHCGGEPTPYAPQLVPLRDLFTITMDASNPAAVTFTVTPTATLLAMNFAGGLDSLAALATLAVAVDYDDGGTRKWSALPLQIAAAPLLWTTGGTSDAIDLSSYGFGGTVTITPNGQNGFVWRAQPASFIGGVDAQIEYEMRDANTAGTLQVNGTPFAAMNSAFDSDVFWYGSSGAGPLGGFMLGPNLADGANGAQQFSDATIYVRQRFQNAGGTSAWLSATLPAANCAPAQLSF